MGDQNFDNLDKSKSMNIRILSFLIIFSIAGLGAAPNKVLTLEEKEELKQIETVRKGGFTDIEVDNLHASIAGNILRINNLLANETYKKALRYIEDEPREAAKFLFQDKENKQYLELDLGLGQSFADYPKTYLYQSRIYIYPATDGQSLDKIILQFKRTNAKGEVFIREMRRLINNSPKGPTFLGDGKRVPNNNSEILLEFFSSHDTDFLWPDNPIQPVPASVTTKLHDSANPLPYNKQRQIILQYKRYLRKVDKMVALKLHAMELDQKIMISKMLEFR
ncbi:hypothetical protein LEP1GSC175_3186 [Leptospira santarosai str. HAI821]|uniref:Uncharacterized protein n=3 Tax=Leptospira santarosai TaxID=28183 RepID=M6UFZ9_9LEPT|nr:hypothetical protein LEP1GSC071_1954 [Leptospira santarosai str. JET]EKT86807.1 hypothetical protein LSS_10178 [Leptospira santarosai serovar Shermani str. LT 821]EMM77114.1 hypothetical protein LEP1GSC040_2791 [Leptospira santarosai str. 2000030832]EMO34537.1 hypothetical protein LEP1GSC175_3186 [Leptospira santarosai str. HAI821]EMO43475.1 hypothetical protein LEP1GSC187_3019 [Leptospira santarosai str. ZUN179]EMO83115.1 hypothetical protein LEP1GSC070_2528 [Leptospira santarosai str. AIM